MAGSSQKMLSSKKRVARENMNENEDSNDPVPGDNRCVICLGRLVDKSFTDNCFHNFCFMCLVRWSKVKALCPLCKQPFKSILHKIGPRGEYEQYNIPRPQPSVLLSNFMSYRLVVDALNHSARDYLAQILDQNYIYGLYTTDESVPPFPVEINTRGIRILNRRAVYQRNMWAHPLPNDTGRIQECNPAFYRDNPAGLNRLIPWINREIRVVLPSDTHFDNILQEVLQSLRTENIASRQFRRNMYCFFESTAIHFVHELTIFAQCIHDLAGYDENVRYSPPRIECFPLRSRSTPTASSSAVIEVVDVTSDEPNASDSVLSDSDSDVIVLEEIRVNRPEGNTAPIMPEPIAGTSGIRSVASTSGTSQSGGISENGRRERLQRREADDSTDRSRSRSPLRQQ